MRTCLEVNGGGVPIGIVPIKRAMSAVASKKAVSLANYKESVSIPSVIQFINTSYTPKKFTRILPFNRKNVYIRDHGRCMYCGKAVSLNSFTFDHVIPRCRGGKDWWDNVVVSCLKCNNKKDWHMLSECGMKLIRKPYIPILDKAAPSHVVSRIAFSIPHETWVDFIYWNIILRD